MVVKYIVDEDFINYKLPSMLIAMPICNWKCCIERKMPVEICQNSPLAKQKNIIVNVGTLIQRYLDNPITKAIVFGGLEPFDSSSDLFEFISSFRRISNDDIVIYTGYYPNEIETFLETLSLYSNIIIKFGRYIPNRKTIHDNILGIDLASDNQFAIKIS